MSMKPTPEQFNSTDATRGLPLVDRVQLRLDELIRLRDECPADRQRARADLEVAILGGETLLADHGGSLSDARGIEMNRWLERNKHLAEATPQVDPN